MVTSQKLKSVGMYRKVSKKLGVIIPKIKTKKVSSVQLRTK